MSFVGAVRIGARVSEADMSQVDARVIANFAEEIVAELTETVIRKRFHDCLARTHHPSWYEDPDWQSWRRNLFESLICPTLWKAPRFRLITGAKEASDG